MATYRPSVHKIPANLTFEQRREEYCGLIGRMHSTLESIESLLELLDRPASHPYRREIAWRRQDIEARLAECDALFPPLNDDAAASAQAGAGASAGEKS